MKKYLLVYYGGKMENDPKKAQVSMSAWIKWFQDLGKAVVDTGNPTMPGNAVSSKGVTKGTVGEAVTGYSIIQANDLDAATDMTKKCPQLGAGGQIGIYEIMPMM